MIYAVLRQNKEKLSKLEFRSRLKLSMVIYLDLEKDNRYYITVLISELLSKKRDDLEF